MKVYRRLNSIKALSFDLDDTLYDNHPVIRKVESEMAIWLRQHHPISAQLSFQQWKELKLQLAETRPELKHDMTLWRKTQIEQGLKQLGYNNLKAKKASEEGIEHALWLRNQVDVPFESHQTLQALKEKFPLIAITNGNVDVHEIGLSQYFDLVLKAGPDGRSKPYPDMFLAASDYLDLPQEQILHIGDHLISDVSGSKRCGFSTCWINTSMKPIAEHHQARVLPDIEIENVSELLYLV
ncbi:5-amino-6-(5-phospho-D-ribitylamino)uracil phosphatase YigB [Vibrio sp. F74]|uniref:5-amino-6-(5-phospho-D-ribitylamino)uracil phosphatase YigB n=1 Tax=Vibrio sp. F74 TaxID=700020 RepID=UPI0035F5BA15